MYLIESLPVPPLQRLEMQILREDKIVTKEQKASMKNFQRPGMMMYAFVCSSREAKEGEFECGASLIHNNQVIL